jgi:hypothetical protein
MYRSLLLGALAGCLVSVVPASAVPASAHAHARPNFVCDGTYVHRTFKHVRVRPGDTCVLIDSTVTGNLMARNPRTVKVLDTTVAHNLMIRGATDDVVIGNRGCRFDPTVGNNIKVTKSHDVAICWMQVKNNLTVTGNDGRINVSHNDVGRSLSISRNLAYVADSGVTHRSAGAIRVKHNTAGNHIRLFANDPSRTFRGLATNSPSPEVK